MSSEVRERQFRERRSRKSRAAREVVAAKTEADNLEEQLSATSARHVLRRRRLERARDAARKRERDSLKRLTWKNGHRLD